MIFFRPVYAADGTSIVDLAYVHLNPAAQRMHQLPPRPAETFLTLYPNALKTGIFAFYRDTFLSGKAGRYDVNYSYDGLDNYFHLAAQPSGQLLVVSLSDTSHQDRTRVEVALRENQARERENFYQVFEQAPVIVALLRGPEHFLYYRNPAFQALFPGRKLTGHFYGDVMPEMVAAGLMAELDRVYATGQPCYGAELPVIATPPDGSAPHERYYDFSYQAQRENGEIAGISIFAYDVTERVQARRQAEALQAELRAVAEHSVRERETLYQVFAQTPAAICIQRGPEHRYEYANPAYQALFPDRELLGRPLADALPETVEQGFAALLDGVYQTGQTYFGVESPVVLRDAAGQPARTIYFTFTYQAYQENGQTVGIFTFAYDVTEQVLARAQAERQRRLLNELFKQAPTGICILAGPELVYEFVNPAYQQLLPGRALLGKPILEALPELDGTPVPATLRSVYETGETHQEHGSHVPVMRPDGQGLEERYFTFVYQARRDEHGQIDGVLAFVFEVTGQVLARRKIEESAQQVRAVVEGAPFPIGVYVGPEFRIQLANQAILEVWGKGPNVIGKRFDEVLPELENQAVFGQLRQVFSTGQPLHLRNQELEVVMDGVPQTFYYNYSFTPLRDTRGEVYGILNTAADVTDSVVARRRTEEAAAELRLVTAHAPAFLYRADAAGNITYVNERLIEWGGLDRARMATLNETWAIVYPEDLPAMQASYVAALSAGQPWESEPCRFLRHDGRLRWMLSRSQPFLGPDGKVAGYNGVTTEIHDQVELQRELTRTNQDLERANKDLDNFIYTASHDLKAPISNIEGLMKVLSRKVEPSRKEDETVQQIFAMIETSVRRFKATISDLTDIARIQKQLDGESEPVDLREIVSDTLLDLQVQVNESGSVIEQDLEACPTIQFPRKNLKSVVYNLVSNALKYRDPRRTPHITLGCYPEGDYQVLLVQDNGLGMNTTDPEKIFGMFKRQHAHVEGTGIGLYIVKKMLENAGGKIDVESQVGVGSTFRVYFTRFE